MIHNRYKIPSNGGVATVTIVAGLDVGNRLAERTAAIVAAGAIADYFVMVDFRGWFPCLV